MTVLSDYRQCTPRSHHVGRGRFLEQGEVINSSKRLGGKFVGGKGIKTRGDLAHFLDNLSQQSHSFSKNVK